MSRRELFQLVGSVVVGLAVTAGAAAAWHYWQINGLVASVVGLIGLAIAGSQFGD